MIKVSYLQFGLLCFTEGDLRVGVGGYSSPSTMDQGCMKSCGGLTLQFTNMFFSALFIFSPIFLVAYLEFTWKPQVILLVREKLLILFCR